MLRRFLLATGAALLLAPAAANADSIVYIDQGNVWSASPDGARKVQLTSGGQWHSPTQADDGTIAAVQGTGPITVMARNGPVAAHDHDAHHEVRGRRDLRAAPGEPVVLARRQQDRLLLPGLQLPGRLDLRLDPALDVLHGRQRHAGHAGRHLRQPVQRLRPGVGDQQPHARVRRLRAPGGDRRPRPGRVRQPAVDGPERRHGRRRAHAATAPASR